MAGGVVAHVRYVRTTAPRAGTAIVSEKLNQPTQTRRRRVAGACGVTLPELALEPRPEHVVVEQRTGEEEARRAPT